jgi:hypothetical protein
MQHEDNYRVILTHENIPVFLIRALDGAPSEPFLLYDGSKHATFYRREDQTLLLDYLNDKVVEVLQNTNKVVIFELNDEIEDISRDYEASVKHIKKNVFTDGLS